MSESLDRAPELLPAISALHSFKFNPPDQIVPYLIAEYGLTGIEDYIKDPRQVLSEGLLWQRLIGTPAAIHRALRWIQQDGDIEEASPYDAKWWQFQIHLPTEVTSSDFVKPMTKLVKASKPLRSDFVRVTSGWDVRAFRLDKHRLDGGAYLDDWSGIRRSDDEPVLSLRFHHRDHVRLWPSGGVPVRGIQSVKRALHVRLGLRLQQRDGGFAGSSNSPARLSDPAVQPFRNAPFINTPFGTPPFRAHSGI